METLLISSQTAQLKTSIASDKKKTSQKKLSWSSHKIYFYVCYKDVETD